MTELNSRVGAKAHQVNPLVLSEPDGKAVLSAAGLTVPRGVVIAAKEATALQVLDLNFPVAVKAVSSRLVHKSDQGGVLLNIASVEDVRAACRTIQAALTGTNLDGFLIEEMAPSGHELIVGGLQDEQFGPVIMIGLGGIFTEIFSDTSFRICPVTRTDAVQMLDSLQAAPLLAGARGGVRASRQAIIDVLLNLGGENGLLLQDQQNIHELDINPLIVSQTGAVAADARIVIAPDPNPIRAIARAPIDSETIRAQFEPLFNPAGIAVAGASAKARNRANIFVDQLLSYGFARERLYIIHPTAKNVDGIPAYASFSKLPAPVDYAYIAVPAARVPALLDDAAGFVKFAHVISSGFAEIGQNTLQDELVSASRRANVRVLGPNCNGGHSPRGKLTFC